MMNWQDVSNANSPYDNEFFDANWQPRGIFSQLGQDPSAEEALPVLSVEDLPCDFTAGDGVVALQEALVREGHLDAAGITGTFDDATCEAWHERFGEPPTPAALTETILGKSASCASVVMPACTKLAPKSKWTTPRVVGLAAAAGITAFVFSMVLRGRAY